jgi:hypothetical protein
MIFKFISKNLASLKFRTPPRILHRKCIHRNEQKVRGLRGDTLTKNPSSYNLARHDSVVE